MKIDVRGEICPYPMMKTAEALKKLDGDEAWSADRPRACARYDPLGSGQERLRNNYRRSRGLGVAADATEVRKKRPSRKSFLPTCRSNSQR